VKIIIADEQPLFRDALIRVLSQQTSEPEIIEVDNFVSLEHQLQENPDIDYVFMDVHISGNTGLSGLATLRLSCPHLNMVIVSASESPMVVYRAIKLGAVGFVPKSSNADIFGDAINTIFSGQVWLPKQLKNPLDDQSLRTRREGSICISEKIASLSPRQFKVLSMLSDGKLNKQIAYTLDIQEATIKHHVSLILQKLNVVNRTGAANMFNRLKVEKRIKARTETLI